MRNLSQTSANPYRALPSVDRLAADALAEWDLLDPALVVELAREALDEARARIAAGNEAADPAGGLRDRILELDRPVLRPVLNATGVIIHTNLGRAPLSAAARAAIDAVNRGYSNLEFDLEAGERGSRHGHLDGLLRRVTGAEAGFAVNNNASAVMLTLSALCAGRDVIISRGQLVEIGGGFRIPDVLRQSGARLVEVGTTNRTYTRDYLDAVTPETAAFLRVHSSNFRVIGFTHEPELTELTAAAHERGVVMLDDLGSGCLLDTTAYGLAPEPTVQASMTAGVDLAMFSGDKLLGAPQAGVIAGRGDLVDQARRHPLARAVRLDKASLAGLAATLTHYVRREAPREVPVWRMIATPLDEIEQRASAWMRAIDAETSIEESRSMIGGGSLPEESLPSRALAIRHPHAALLARALRRGETAVVARVERDRLLLDPRTVMPEDDGPLVAALQGALPSP